MGKRKKSESKDFKTLIIELFEENVKGRSVDSSSSNKKHDGKDGHWLETQMRIAHNAKNEPDIFGYEMKNDTSQKTTFGDWSANYYIFKDERYGITRDEFLMIFGSPNQKENGRFSWSGKPCPKINTYNLFGQILVVDEDNNIIIKYSYQKDTRSNKKEIVPIQMKNEDLVLARWNADSIKLKVEKKFNKLGWFKCKKNDKGVYQSIAFGEPIDFYKWIEGVRRGDIFFDSGMYQGNKRNYSQWRARNYYWDSLITEEY